MKAGHFWILLWPHTVGDLAKIAYTKLAEVKARTGNAELFQIQRFFHFGNLQHKDFVLLSSTYFTSFFFSTCMLISENYMLRPTLGNR